MAAWQRRVARARGLAAAKTGAITFVKRFGGLVGVFGPAAKARSKLRALIPATNTADAATARQQAHRSRCAPAGCRGADLPRRVFAEDVLT